MRLLLVEDYEALQITIRNQRGAGLNEGSDDVRRHAGILKIEYPNVILIVCRGQGRHDFARSRENCETRLDHPSGRLPTIDTSRTAQRRVAHKRPDIIGPCDEWDEMAQIGRAHV